ncbi:class II aldolase/adducin family protein [Pseudonocardia acaciae]|uniref:class II aldolase/adducin family protein n=1 Tax=Pseudonocardia acaciae TaxID=551276 RepID=UPI00048F9F17|nr:class II aldolase/adducin family protein [Pseudonocardia acaciae]
MRSTVDELLTRLIDAGRTAVRTGLVIASGGNLSVRLPDDTIAVTARGTWLDRLEMDSFSILDPDGNVVDGNPTPSSEWKLHQRTYRVRPDVGSVIHLHPRTAVLLDAMGEQIRLMTLDHAHWVRSIGRVPYHPNGSDELADTSAEQSRTHNCVIQAHHGCSCIGGDIAMALRRAMSLEQAAVLTYQALVLGDRHTSFPRAALAGLGHA